MKFHPDVLAAHAQFGGDLESMQKLYEYPQLKEEDERLRAIVQRNTAEFRIGTYPGYNEPGKGQHGTEIYCALIGNEGAIVWQLNTGIAPTGPYRSQDENANLLEGVNKSYPYSTGVVAHSELTSRTAAAEDHMITDKCEFLSGRACVCDYREYITKEPMMAFACEGFDGVRKVLEAKYLEHYGKEA